jgi:hypothetical protein
VAIHGAIPVIPMRLKVHRYSRIDKGTGGTALRGDTEVVFGKPLTFAIDADPNQATAEIQAAVEAL